ncbi:phosphate ABC transporter substrate-binding protein [Lutispora thermophila]|uniref:Phosphate ABC transporter substrate-binding protein, PhoT family n=1 Tax=Lutispora thermophila DSM 19022 TaxID=1122184 RepID=A0A1M6FFX1_9FIRM|nr:phosphate ABC transporter substrate-binding protein [Lutispora thermophila]SHI96512.1 phosphate ABC transporter substrate-binding protein, PhoT family [Lutispora thermophila DSM 19022]
MKRVWSIIICLSLIFAMVLTGCTSQGADVQTNSNKENETNNEFKAEMTFNGSSTLAPVITAIATEFIEENTTWDKVDSSFPDKYISIYVSAGGSGAGVKAVIEGTADFGMLAREVKSEELEKIGDAKVYKLGVDALTISINPENPLAQLRDNLTTEEVKKIFAGEYKYWDELDSSLPHREIVVVIRDLSGGAHEVFQKSVMGDTQIRPDAIQSPSMGALVTKIIENKDAIGYASYGMVNQNKGKLMPLKVDGVEPTEQTIVDGSYKISRPLIVVKRGELTAPQKAFMDVVMSEKGAEVIEEMGFVPVK